MDCFFAVKRRGLYCLFLVCFMVGLSLRADKVRAGEKTLKRTEDFVVIKGEDVPSLMGADVKDLRLYSCKAQSCRLVPLQVDKVDVWGRYVFPQDQDPRRDGSALDPNDEISFMAEDSGDERLPGFSPSAATRGVELKLTDPVDGSAGWLYLFAVPGAEKQALPDYVSYQEKNGYTSIKSPQFEMGYVSDRIYYDRIKMLAPKGTLGKDILDRQRVGLEAVLKGDRRLPLNVPESIVRVRDLAVIDGPVRVIVDQVVMVHVANLSFKWGVEYYISFFRCGQNNNVTFKSSVPASSFIQEVLFYWGMDFTRDIIGSFYLDPHHLSPVKITGERADSLPGDKIHSWYGLYGPEGTMVQAIKMAEDTEKFFGCGARWFMDLESKDRKGEFPERLEIGFACRELEEVPEKKEFHWQNYILFPKKQGRAGVNEVRLIFEHPLQVEQRPLSLSNPPERVD